MLDHAELQRSEHRALGRLGELPVVEGGHFPARRGQRSAQARTETLRRGLRKKTKVCVPSYLDQDAFDAAAAVPVAEDGELVWVDGAVNLEDVSMHAVEFRT